MYNEIVSMTVPGLPVKVGGKPVRCSSSYVPLHFHDEIEFLLILEGVMICTVEKKEVAVREGEVIMINRRRPHATRSGAQGHKGLLIQMNLEKLLSAEYAHMNKYLSLFISTNERPYYYFDKSSPLLPEISGYLQKISDEYHHQARYYATYIKGAVYSTLGFLYRNSILENLDDKYNETLLRKIWPSLEYIDVNYQKQITLAQLGQIMHMNPAYFCRLFKKATNNTFTEYINFVRIWKAENLLTTTPDTILDISMEVGFASVSYFNRVFKRHKKCTPLEYRQHFISG